MRIQDENIEKKEVPVRHETKREKKCSTASSGAKLSVSGSNSRSLSAVAYLESFICFTIQPFFCPSHSTSTTSLKAFKYCLDKHKNAFSMIR